MTSSGGPKEKRTWDSNREWRAVRRLPGFTSKKIPGTVMTYCSRAARKNFMPVENGSGRPATDPKQ